MNSKIQNLLSNVDPNMMKNFLHDQKIIHKEIQKEMKKKERSLKPAEKKNI